MTTSGLNRALSSFLLFERRTGPKDWETTDRWRDKRAQGALRSGGCFCLVILRRMHIAPLIGNVHRALKSLVSLTFSHIAGARHGR